MADYIPQNDGEAIVEGRVRVDYALGHLADLGLKSDDVAPIETALNDFETDFKSSVADAAAARASNEKKAVTRAAWEKLDRDFNARLARASANDRAAMKLSVRDTIKTPAGEVESHPLGTVDTSQKRQHVISWHDSATPESKARPKNAFGCEIWYKIGGDAPVNAEKECELAATDRNSPYLLELDGADVGKAVYYLLRWVSTNGEKGAWSPLFSATITN